MKPDSTLFYLTYKIYALKNNMLEDLKTNKKVGGVKRKDKHLKKKYIRNKRFKKI